ARLAVGVLLEQAECEATQPCQVLRQASIPRSALVFAECHVQAPVARVLDSPVTANGASEQFHVAFRARNVGLHFARFLGVDLTPSNHQAQRPKPGPFLALSERLGRLRLEVTAAFQATVTPFFRLEAADLDAREIVFEMLVE